MSKQTTVHFLYASQTGNSESIASLLHHQCEEHPGISAGKLMTLDEAVKKSFFSVPSAAVSSSVEDEATKEYLTVVVVTSTHGDGDFPDNGQKFRRWVKTTKEDLSHVRYTVLALGDTNYSNFCAAGKFADMHMDAHGATRFYGRGEADDGVSLELVVDPWCAGLWAAILDIEACVEKKGGQEALAPSGPLDVFLNASPTVVIIYTSGAAQHLAMMLFEYFIGDGVATEILPARSFQPAKLARAATVAILIRDHAVRADAVFDLLDSIAQSAGNGDDDAGEASSGGSAPEAFVPWLKSLARVASLDFLRANTDIVSTIDALQVLKLPNLISQDAGVRSVTIAHALGQANDTVAWCAAVLQSLPGLKKDIDFAKVAATWMDDWAFRGSIDSERVVSKGDGRVAAALGGGKTSRSGMLVDNVLKPLVFLHGGDTPVAAEVAYELAKTAERQGLGCAVAPANHFKSVAFPRQATFVFIVGGPSSIRSSTDRLVKFLRTIISHGESNPEERLGKVRFAVLGIDDRSVSENFNAAALELELHLMEAGASQVHCTGLADVAAPQGIDTVLAVWTRGLWRALDAAVQCQGYIDSALARTMATSGSMLPNAAAAAAVTAARATSSGHSGGTATCGGQQWFPWEEVPVREDVLPRTHLVMLYSSSGMAKTLTKRGASVARELGMPVVVRALDRYEDANLSTVENIIIVCDTTAEGRLSGGRRFMRFIKSRSNAPDMLAHLRYSILGIGEAAGAVGATAGTPKHAAYDLCACLSALGATRVFPVGIITSISEMESYALPWLRGVWGVLTNMSQPRSMRDAAGDGSGAPIDAQHPSRIPSTGAAGATALAPSILFLFGSVTGNAEAIAKDLHREAQQRGLHSRVAALNYFQRMKFTTTQFVVIVCCSTNTPTGFPYNAARFVKYIRSKSLPPDHLSTVNFSVLALGNSRYGDRFCVAGKTLDTRLAALGGVRFLAPGLADETEGLEVTVERWRKELFAVVAGAATPTQTPKLSFAHTPSGVETLHLPGAQGGPAASLPVAGSATAAEDNTTASSGGPPMVVREVSAGVRSATPGGAQNARLSAAAAPAASVLVLFGSQQGNAEAIAGILHQKLLDAGLARSVVGPLNDFNKVQWRTYKHICFVCSTTGDGEFPDNAQQFWRFVRQKSHPDDLLSGLRYAVLALGDTNYSRFCQAGRNIDRRLEELGATRFFARAEADDAFDLDAVVAPWMDSIVSALEPKDCTSYSASAGRHAEDVEASSVASSKVVPAVAVSGAAAGSASNAIVHTPIGEPNTEAFTVRIKHWEMMTSADDVMPVVHLTFAIDGEGHSWNPGDAIGIMPINDDATVEYILDRLGVRGDDPFLPPRSLNVESAFPNAPLYSRLPFPNVTNRSVLQRYVSLRIHNKNVIQLMFNSTVDNVEQSVLASWLQPQSKEWGQRLREKITIADVLRQFGGVNPSFRHVVETLMVLQPRYYSICSAHSADPRALSIAFRMVHRGVCTSWLYKQCQLHSQLQHQQVELSIFLRKSAEFKMPADPTIPMILIGPGTGIAPFISFLEHRDVHHRSNPGAALGETHVFFGCRHRDSDFLFADKLQRFEKTRVVHSLHLAFSQESNDGLWYGGCYVQDKIQECSNHLCHLILNCSAHVYVCGDAESMARDVHRILIDILDEYRCCGHQEVEELLETMVQEGRYQRDIWS